MIVEILAWLQSQSVWVDPVLSVLIAFACIKYILFD